MSSYEAKELDATQIDTVSGAFTSYMDAYNNGSSYLLGAGGNPFNFDGQLMKHADTVNYQSHGGGSGDWYFFTKGSGSAMHFAVGYFPS